MKVKLQLIHVMCHCLPNRWKLSNETQYCLMTMLYCLVHSIYTPEQSFLGIYVDLINGSGLLGIMNDLNFTTIGLSGLTAKADGSSIKRAWYSMQVTSCVLYSKLTEAAQTMGSTNYIMNGFLI